MPSAISARPKAAPERPSPGAAFVLHSKVGARRAVRVGRRVYPQWLRTALVTFLWLGTMNFWVSVTSMYASYGGGVMSGVGLALFAAVGSHVWPTRTSPWRTVALTGLLTMWLGATLLVAGMNEYALTISSIVGITFILGRINQNARKLYRSLMLRPLGDN